MTEVMIEIPLWEYILLKDESARLDIVRRLLSEENKGTYLRGVLPELLGIEEEKGGVKNDTV